MKLRGMLFATAAAAAIATSAFGQAATPPTMARVAAADDTLGDVEKKVQVLQGELQKLQQQLDAMTADQAGARDAAARENARAAAERETKRTANTPPAVLAQTAPAASVAPASPLEERVRSLEQTVNNTTVTGRMYLDASHIDAERDGVARADNGWGFDAKRFYISIDHRFNDIFSADVTTDFNYISADGETQLFIKKAYLQATLDPALILRAGSADLPWIPFNEGVYGYRYLENVLDERVGFGTSADWGVHALGNFVGGLFSYDVAVINGAGYKKLVRVKGVDVEGRANINYLGFTAAVGGRTGHLGQDVQGTPALHDATRMDALLSYTAMGARVGVQYMRTSNWNQVTKAPSDSGDGYSVWGSYYVIPQWAIFGRYDWVKPSRDLNPQLNDRYYNLGITYTPARTIDFSLTYKHEDVTNGFWTTTNGVIGGLVNSVGHNGKYDEIGIFSDFQW